MSPRGYRELKSIEGKVVGYVCNECGRLNTAEHLETCSLGPNPEIDNPEIEVVRLRAENALLRKALEDAPHEEHCEFRFGLIRIPNPVCTCWKAALARIPEAAK